MLAIDEPIEDAMGPVDALKLRSSLTLFEAVDGDPVFANALDKHFDGERDQATLDLLAEENT